MEELPKVADYLTHCINNKIPVCFLKYGDGEYQCSRRFRGHNCDADSYTLALSNGILSSFKYLAEKPNVLIGGWHASDVCMFWQSLIKTPINWVNYHTIIIDEKDITFAKNGSEELNNKIAFFKTIQETKLPKIIVCNELLQRAAIFLKTDEMIHVPLRNWFDTHFREILQKIITSINTFLNRDKNAQCIIMFAAGMSSKVLIGELYRIFPQNIYLDFGSAIDLLCTKRDSRGRGYSYDTLCEVLSDILPSNEIWNDPKYDNIYDIAQRNLGIHL